MNIETFWQSVTPGHGCCWLWTRGKTAGGYGSLVLDGRRQYAHRVAYRLFKGEVPAGYELDHLCRNTSCLNPAHLEAVTHTENVRRGAAALHDVCQRGHDVSDGSPNVRRTADGWKKCHACQMENQRRRRAEAGFPK